MINRDFRRFWTGQAISLLGDTVFNTSLLLWIAVVLLRDKGYAPIASSAVLLAAAVVGIVVAPVAGVLVDRWDKRRTMLCTDLIRFVLVGGLTLLSCVPAVPVPIVLTAIVIVIAVSTAAGGFFNLARVIFVGDVVPAGQLGRASGLVQAAGAGAAIAGPPLAAPLLVGVGVQWALGFNAVSFLVSYLLLRSVRPRRPDAAAPSAAAPAGILREFGHGLRLFRTGRVLLTLLITTTLVMLGAGAVNALDVYFLQENLHGDPTMFGLLGGAFGAGALVGSAVAGVFADRLGPARVFRVSLLLAAGLFLVYSRMDSVWPAIAVAMAFSVGLGGVSTVAVPLIMRSVPRSHLGRVLSVFGPVNQAASVISLGAAGTLVGFLPSGFHTTVAGVGFGRIDLVFFGSATLMLAGAFYAFVGLRGADTASDAAPDDDDSSAGRDPVASAARAGDLVSEAIPDR